MILVTGSKGFLGRNLVKKLEAAEYEVYGIDRVDGNPFYMLDQVPWQRIKRVYHLGAITNTTELDVDLIYNMNVKFSIDLMTAAFKRKIPIHYASSAAVYGNSVYNEINPLNHYAMSKATVDLWVKETMWDYPIVGFRFFNVYGLNEDKGEQSSIINKLINQTASGTLKIFKGSETIFRDFVHVDDVIEILMMKHEPGIWDVGTGKAPSVKEVAKMISDKTNAAISVIPFPKLLEGKYQYFTHAQVMPKTIKDYKFKTVEEWLVEVF